MNEHSFSERLKTFRKAKGLTQQQLADQLGISNKSVSRWESEGGYPDVELLAPLAKALGVTVDELLSDTPVRRLSTFDWQNMLSFALAIGGGVLYFLLDLFVPSVLCYCIYLGIMSYGVYLQSRYTYRSDWFYRFNLLTNFFVNFSLLVKLPWFTASFTILAASGLMQTMQNITVHSDAFNTEYIQSQFAYLGIHLLRALLCIVLLVALTALTHRILRKKLDSGAPEGILAILFPAKATEKVESTSEETAENEENSSPED